MTQRGVSQQLCLSTGRLTRKPPEVPSELYPARNNRHFPRRKSASPGRELEPLARSPQHRHGKRQRPTELERDRKHQMDRRHSGPGILHTRRLGRPNLCHHRGSHRTHARSSGRARPRPASWPRAWRIWRPRRARWPWRARWRRTWWPKRRDAARNARTHPRTHRRQGNV